MNEKTLSALRKKAQEIREKIWDDGLVRTTGPGDSSGTKDLKFHHSLEETSLYFALGKFTGNIDTNTGVNILGALERHQVIDEKDELFGTFPLYSEEEHPGDSSHVFAVTAPLATVKIAAPQALTLGEIAIIDRILDRSGRWLGN